MKRKAEQERNDIIKYNTRAGAEILILALLQNADAAGYQLRNEIAIRSNGTLTYEAEDMYPVLYRMVKLEYLSDYHDTVGHRMHVYYHLEDDGRTHLKRCLDELRDIREGIARILGDPRQDA